jgi:hypothetical protein
MLTLMLLVPSIMWIAGLILDTHQRKANRRANRNVQ